MQVNNSELFNPAGVAAPPAQERPEDGLFDALLREEEARYDSSPRADEGRDRHATEYDRREAEDPYREPERGARSDTESREDTARREAEPRAESDDRPEDHNPDSEHRDPQPQDDDPASHTGSDDNWADASTAAASDTPTVTTAGQNGSSAAQGAAAGAAPGSSATDRVITAANSGMTGDSGDQPGHSRTGAGTTPSIAGQGTGDAASTPAAPSNGQPPASTASPINTAATDKPAKTAGESTKAAATAAAAQAASAQTAASAQPKNAKPADRQSDTTLPEEVKVTTVRAENGAVTSRPSAALGGGAATAALAEEAKPAANRAVGDDNKPANAAPGANSGTDVLKGQNDATVKANRPSDAGTFAVNNAAGVTAGDTATNGSSGTSGNGPTTPGLQTAGTSAPAGGLSGTSVQTTSFAEAMNSTRGASTQAPAEQIAIQIQKAAAAGKDQLNIKLHPAELGRIEVRLESGNDGVIRAVISAERSETLDLLQRDARGLERALQDAGVKTDSGSLNFNLKGQQFADQERSEGQAQGRLTDEADGSSNDPQNLAATQQPASSHHDGALDIRV